jgi:biotin operon repressor
MVTLWEYTIKTEAERLLHCARQMAVGFYRVNNFIVLPYSPKVKSVNIVTFPELPYHQIPRFWKKVSFIDIQTLPIKVDSAILSQTMKLLGAVKLPNADYVKTRQIWNKAQNEVISEIYRVMPVYKNRIKKITIYPTSFGTSSSFNLINKQGEIILYLRQDKGIATIAEAIITALTRKDVYTDLEGIWQESEIITDWLITKTSVAEVIKKYDKDANYLPTMKGVRIKQQAKLLAESEDLYQRLGLPVNQKVFGLNGNTPEINKKPIENLSITEKKLIKTLIQNQNNVVTFDDLAEQISKGEENFSLYAISKTIQRLRNKLEANGISGSYIQTLRGKGYLLKN